MIETYVGKVSLDKRQRRKIGELHSDKIVGITIRGDEVFVSSEEELTNGEIRSFENRLKNFNPPLDDYEKVKDKKPSEYTLEELVKALKVRGVL